MPRIVSPWTEVGRLTEQAAKACGLTSGTRVVAGCGDSAASALGAGIVEKDMIYDVAGTASIFPAARTALRRIWRRRPYCFPGQ